MITVPSADLVAIRTDELCEKIGDRVSRLYKGGVFIGTVAAATWSVGAFTPSVQVAMIPVLLRQTANIMGKIHVAEHHIKRSHDS